MEVFVVACENFGKYGRHIKLRFADREAVCPEPADELEKRAFNELTVVDAIAICPRRNPSPNRSRIPPRGEDSER